MRYRITFLTGLAVGYVLGTKAGRERYEQLARTARRVADNPSVRRTAETVRTQATAAGRTARSKAGEKLPVSSVTDFLARPTEEESAELNGTRNGTGGTRPDNGGR
ncbi:hypothetical protein FHX37_0994 [Haloactinospora alba]|uniref:YtxH-like protein n=1 Tax=Haloactinospora alba TaxID=405555 RepID=A0A543NGX6_9ACTN|nr:hypothetical protein [Haloactinospora alba]TQN31105.1 hypothetical protein FHX37_0994 [Haloactinospora alba]